MNSHIYSSAFAGLAHRTFSFDGTGLSGSDLSLIAAVAVPLVAAFIVFVCCFRAKLRRKFLMFFLTMLSFIAVTLFVFSDLRHFFSAVGIGIDTLSDGFLELAGLTASSALGVLLLGLNAFICSSGITKQPGRIAAAISTVVFAAADFAMFLNLILSDTVGSMSSVDIEIIGKDSQSSVISIGFDFIAVAALAVHSVILLLSFIANKTKAELREEDRLLLEGLENEDDAATVQTADEKCCAVCQYAMPLCGYPDKVLCDRNGVTSSGYKCRKFIYDPLKKKVSRPETKENGESDDE